jgi:hypothetical protein
MRNRLKTTGKITGAMDQLIESLNEALSVIPCGAKKKKKKKKQDQKLQQLTKLYFAVGWHKKIKNKNLKLLCPYSFLGFA